ncbi:Cystathionine beta-lyase family protein involved in aluminum resistance [Lacicoccus alkaliphilus]|uniref:Cystathionine beta-lyase family protein involved in aluminum resistance n=1 Tax=Lacicoccus alkaliphilus DSM 16010 TaxID=1123231 RepID=A0A1M7BZM0_9BACL|nr:Cystathionine beta-lyase family protein involved in aluminum resistance [Salinicoccus alkaliphilus DSM 16010]
MTTLAVRNLIEASLEEIEPIIKENKKLGYKNFSKVMQAFLDNEVTDTDFSGTTGYGYNDIGRDKLEYIYRDVFKAEDALVRSQIISGTHAISLVLLSLLRKGDELLYITGTPYDTLEKVVGRSKDDIGSLHEEGVSYGEVDLKDGTFDIEGIMDAINDRTKVIGIQRSRGYSLRRSTSIDEIETVCRSIKEKHPDLIIFVDNCYGEFVEEKEPLEAGADIIAGSLIKNPGGGIAKMGGYIAGRTDLVERVSYRLTVPGIGKEMGASLNVLTDMFQGFYMAPHAVMESLNGAVLTSHVLGRLGMATDPLPGDKRTDLIQTVSFNSEEEMIKFTQMIQKASPVNAKFMPVPDLIPGYQSPVIMAAGTFVQGASLELSADGPIRAPYTVFVQGGLVMEHVIYALHMALEELI